MSTDSLNRCPECGYTKEDELIHWDHHLCKGKIPDGTCEISVIEKALANAAEILANFKSAEPHTDGTPERKIEEWQACYAMLFKQMTDLVASTREPVSKVVREQKACPAGCDDGVDWSSGKAEICEECEGSGTFYVTQQPVDSSDKWEDITIRVCKDEESKAGDGKWIEFMGVRYHAESPKRKSVKPKTAPCICDDGNDWSSGKALPCDLCGGSGELLVLDPTRI